MSLSLANPVTEGSLPGRHAMVLKAVVRSYIESGVPVGSHTLVRLSGIGLSPATIRNVMADLCDMGYLTQPHTSAGRMPTDRAYRFYADELLDTPTLSNAQQEAIRQVVTKRQEDVTLTLQDASLMLAGMTRYACMVLVPAANQDLLRHIQFLGLADTPHGHQRVMALLVTVTGQVQNRVFVLQEEMSQSQLDAFARSLSKRLQGLTLAQVRDQLEEEVARGQQEYEALLQKILETLQEATVSRLIVNGQGNLLSFPELGPLDTLGEVMSALDEKRRLVRLLDECLKADGVRLFIGSQLPDDRLHHLSVVAAKFTGPHQHMCGSVGVLGPSRLDYDQVIPLVDYTARLLSSFWHTPQS
ncbi:MAG: heat-inducible transcription repressor HrcA [Magnetococcales bacterium]|nr:heat-inducible transcription repressor HrcA [Magnetococcales bacterium]NGZ27292.1 heat-inducible transcription repressor HrcA [Magnetococcales bacterium]